MSKIIKIGQLPCIPQLIANNLSGCFFLKHGVDGHNMLLNRARGMFMLCCHPATDSNTIVHN